MTDGSPEIVHLVAKRQATLDYFKRVLQGRTFWLNVGKLSHRDILDAVPEQPRKHR